MDGWVRQGVYLCVYLGACGCGVEGLLSTAQPFRLPGLSRPGSLTRALPWPLRAFVGDSHDGFHVYPRDRNTLPGVA